MHLEDKMDSSKDFSELEAKIQDILNDKNDDYIQIYNYNSFRSYRIPPILISILDGFIQKTGCHKAYIPFAAGEDVIKCKEIGVSVDYCNPDKKICDTIKKKTGIEALKTTPKKGKYDIVFSDLPFGPVLPHAQYSIIVEEACDIINDKTYALFTFSSAITASNNGKKWLKELEKRGIYVNAIINLPSGSYLPVTMVESRIIVFSKNNTPDVFFAQLSDEREIGIILDNLLSHKDSLKGERLGKWVTRGSYSDYSDYDNSKRKTRILKKLEDTFNGKATSIKDISLKIEAPREGGFAEEVEAAVYVPKLGKSKVVTRMTDYEIKPHNYFRIIVNQDKIIPGFLAFVLNTESGIDLRLRAMSGNTIQALNKPNLEGICIPLPSISFQGEILKLDNELNQIAQETEKLKERLKQLPVAYKDIRKGIKKINNTADDFEQWVEELPFPLATILRKYQVAVDARDKQDMLLHFFEAYAIFKSAILVGGYGKYPKKELGDVTSSFFEKASFGAWVKLSRAISSHIRTLMDNKNTMDAILECFCTDERSIINTISSKDICNILDRACNNRNSWSGHSGITGESKYVEHVKLLEDDLRLFQTKIDDLYGKLQLIRLKSLEYEHGEFTYTVEMLTGSNSIFKTCKFNGSKPLEKNKLYIRVTNGNKVFEIPPFVVMKSSPSEVKNACYFYSRVEGNKTRYVSYHYEGEPEDFEPGNVPFIALKSFLEE